MNSDSVIKGFDVFKNQVVCVSVILNVKTVKPFPLYLGFVIAWTDYGNVAVIVSVLWFPSGKGANADAQVLCTLKLCEIRMLLTIVDGIQFELFGMLFSWHNEYLLLVLYNIFGGKSHFVLHYLYASTILQKRINGN